MNIIGVRFKKAGKIYFFDPDGKSFKRGDGVIVETSRGVEYGTVEIENREEDTSGLNQSVKKIIRPATKEDNAKIKRNKENEAEAFDICVAKIKKLGLKMKLIEVEYTFDVNKIIFYFTADGRIDFRELVKELAAVFKTRIELRQIGVRDEAKMLNGIGICGRTLCCATFLGDFNPVSIKMAKDQGLSLNPSKISGMCGRLMCCLKYEQDTYEELNKNLPSEGDIVETAQGRGEVLSVNVLRQNVKVAVRSNKDDTPNIGFFSVNEIKVVKRTSHHHNDRINSDEFKDILD